MNISGGVPQSLRLGTAGGFACPPPPLPVGGCPPPPPLPVGGVGAGAGAGTGMGAGGTLESVTFPLAMCAASLECVCVAMVGSMGDCRMV